MKKYFSIFSGFYILVLAACNTSTPIEPGLDLAVVRAYLFAGEPVTDIQISSTLAIGSEESTAPPINDAVVSLLKDGVQYDLQASEGDSGYYHYPQNDLIVEQGDVFQINVEYFGRTTRGETEVPEPPRNLINSTDTLYVPEVYTPRDFIPDSSRHVIQIKWDPIESALFFVTIENLEHDPEAIDLFGKFGGRGGFKGGRFFSAPTSRNEYKVDFMSLKYYGRHRMKVYRVNQEYADLYRSRNQDSRDLNEPLTNIKDGLGVFSAFNSVMFDFNVVKE